MIRHAYRAHPLRTAVFLGLSLPLAACATPKLDQRIRALNDEIVAERQMLAPLAAPYRGPAEKDVQLEVTGRPIEDTIEAFNNLSSHDRTMSLQSYDYSGFIAESWTKCWPLKGKIGFQVVPAFKEAFAAVLYLDHVDHDWNQNDGLAFRLKDSFGAGGLIVGGRVEFCGVSGTIPIGGAVVGFGAHSAAGNTSLDTPGSNSITYHVHLNQPIYMIAYVVTPVFSTALPLWFKFELTKGEIPSVLGQSGSIQVTPAGESRNYTLRIRLDRAGFLPKGLSTSGKVDVDWGARISARTASLDTAPAASAVAAFGRSEDTASAVSMAAEDPSPTPASASTAGGSIVRGSIFRGRHP